ncbi:MAG: hypothetical protein KC535_05930 [Nanoarchaeota archaeon]|nr:hypothetical protein [Nanoarchaeota archaeon]
MIISAAFTALLIIIAAFIIASLPLHIAVKLLGGKSSIIKAILVNVISGIVVGAIYAFLPFASIIAFIALIWLYHEIFRLRWFKAFLAWIIQITLSFLLILLLGIIFGASLFL